MNRNLLVLVLWFISGSMATHGMSAEDSKGEFEGTWILTYLELDGKEIKPSDETKSVITGDKFIVKAGDRTVVAGSFKVDDSVDPHAIDMTYTEGAAKGQTFKGIYKRDGDVLTFCRAGRPTDARPTKFETSAEHAGLLTKYKREGK
jgi:uncharacterized protein (TIGR03067 family)